MYACRLDEVLCEHAKVNPCCQVLFVSKCLNCHLHSIRVRYMHKQEQGVDVIEILSVKIQFNSSGRVLLKSRKEGRISTWRLGSGSFPSNASSRLTDSRLAQSSHLTATTLDELLPGTLTCVNKEKQHWLTSSVCVDLTSEEVPNCSD